MGVTGYLLRRHTLDRGTNPDDEVILYETKVFVPFAWSVLFSQSDLRRLGGDLVLAAQVHDAIALARARLERLEPVVTPRLRRILDEFVSSIPTAEHGWLVLDPYRIEVHDTEGLLAPLRWFDRPDVDAVESVFGDDDGIELSDDAGRVDVGDLECVAGWTVDGVDAPWIARGLDDDDDDA